MRYVSHTEGQTLPDDGAREMENWWREFGELPQFIALRELSGHDTGRGNPGRAWRTVRVREMELGYGGVRQARAQGTECQRRRGNVEENLEI